MHGFPSRDVLRSVFISLFHKSLAINSHSPAVHVIRIHGIYDKNRSVLYGMSAFLALQVVVTAVSCAFYRCESTPSSLMSLLSLIPWKLFRYWWTRGASLGRSIIGLVSTGYRPHCFTQSRYDNTITNLCATNQYTHI